MNQAYYKYKYYKYKYKCGQIGGMNNDIHIILIDRTIGGIVAPTIKYKKEIIINENEHVIIINGIKNNIDKNNVYQLMNDIKELWNLPSAENMNIEVYDGYVLYVKYGNKIWMNGKPVACIHTASQVKPSETDKETYKKISELIFAF